MPSIQSYQLYKLLEALAIAFAVSALFGKWLVPYLRKIKVRQEIKTDGPVWHMSKNGTPTMGGLMFIMGLAAAILIADWDSLTSGEYGQMIVFVFALSFGAVGFLDDYEKLKKKQNLGLTAGKKFILQVVVAALFVFLLRKMGYLTPNLYIPFANISWVLPEWLYFAFAIFAIVATVNAVNLTDGVDGLAAGTSLPVFLFYAAVALAWGEAYLSLGIFSAGVVGALLGFLIYNFNPAKIFMGDTGSLFLGGAVAGMAFALDMPLIILTIGIMYIIEVLSDVIQVGYFKLTHGKRVFKMAPFHHHLEMGGWTGRKWTEKELFALFTGLTAVFCLISYFGVWSRYGV